MSNIKPVSDLRNYNEVLSECVGDQPVYLTKNGHGRYVILDIDEYERQQAKLDLFAKLAEGAASVQKESDWLDTENLRGKLGL